jgi:aspartate/methionine/tyrosine aminotransferase
MRALQEPMIPIVGDLVRRHPGTISLGQGVVYYGPPPEAMEQVARFAENPANHKYQPVEGIPELVAAITAKLRDENGIVADSRSSHVVVTAGGNMAFLEAVLAIADVGDEIVLLSPFYFNHEMAVALAGCRPVIVPTDATTSHARTRSRRRSRRAPARS